MRQKGCRPTKLCHQSVVPEEQSRRFELPHVRFIVSWCGFYFREFGEVGGSGVAWRGEWNQASSTAPGPGRREIPHGESQSLFAQTISAQMFTLLKGIEMA